MNDNRAVAEWAKETRAKLDERLRKLIGQANFDLYYGPSGGGLDDTEEDGETSPYPGFDTACRTIRTMLEDEIPSHIFVDEQDCWWETEPVADECYGCEGAGCKDCDGSGSVEPEPYAKVDRRALIQAIVGKELAGYVS